MGSLAESKVNDKEKVIREKICFYLGIVKIAYEEFLSKKVQLKKSALNNLDLA